MKPIDSQASLIVSALETFCQEDQDEFQSTRSRKLNHGKVGWRKSTKINISAKKTLQLIKDLFTRPLRDNCITIKESVSKDGLGKLTDERLAQVKAKRVVTDDFFAEPSVTKLESTT